MARINRNIIDEAAVAWSKKVVKLARRNLSREKGISSKTLWRSIKFRYDRKTRTISFSMEPYGAFMDKGVSGTGQLHYRGGKSMPVAYNKSEASPEYSFKSSKKTIGGSLKKWLQSKGLNQSLDFVIRRSVHARGIRPRRFFSDTFKEMIPEFNVALEEAATVTVEDTIDEILKPLKN